MSEDGKNEGGAAGDVAGEVVVYTTPLCAPCEALKRYLKANDVAFTVKDVMMDEEAAAVLEARNIRSTPALGVGDLLLAGADLNPERVDQVLGLE
jgi:glutaredoxin-like protein NrdH